MTTGETGDCGDEQTKYLGSELTIPLLSLFDNITLFSCIVNESGQLFVFVEQHHNSDCFVHCCDNAY